MRREGKEGSRHHYNNILYGTVENSRRFDDYRYSSLDARHSLSRELAGLTISAVKRTVSQSSDSRPRPTFRSGKSNDSGLSGFRSSRPRTKQPRTIVVTSFGPFVSLADEIPGTGTMGLAVLSVSVAIVLAECIRSGLARADTGRAFTTSFTYGDVFARRPAVAGFRSAIDDDPPTENDDDLESYDRRTGTSSALKSPRDDVYPALTTAVSHLPPADGDEQVENEYATDSLRDGTAAQSDQRPEWSTIDTNSAPCWNGYGWNKCTDKKTYEVLRRNSKTKETGFRTLQTLVSKYPSIIMVDCRLYGATNADISLGRVLFS